MPMDCALVLGCTTSASVTLKYYQARHAHSVGAYAASHQIFIGTADFAHDVWSGLLADLDASMGVLMVDTGFMDCGEVCYSTKKLMSIGRVANVCLARNAEHKAAYAAVELTHSRTGLFNLKRNKLARQYDVVGRPHH
jgi:hypothetical protein